MLHDMDSMEVFPFEAADWSLFSSNMMNKEQFILGSRSEHSFHLNWIADCVFIELWSYF